MLEVRFEDEESVGVKHEIKREVAAALSEQYGDAGI